MFILSFISRKAIYQKRFCPMSTLNFLKVQSVPIILIVVVVLISCLHLPAYAQLKEPEVKSSDNASYPLKEGLSNSIGGSAFVNNFGFGIGGNYSHALGPFTQFTFFAGVTGIRDASEISIQNFFTGRRVVPNKFNRALGFPFLFGIKKRLFPNQIADNFRFFVAASGGPSLAFVYPYLDDNDGNGFRSTQLVEVAPGVNRRFFTEEINDFFSGLGDGSTEWGATGEIKVGVDLGSNFKRQSTLEIGYFFYYFDQGIQILEPRRPVSNTQGEIIDIVESFDAQKFFGTPQIKFTYSGWW